MNGTIRNVLGGTALVLLVSLAVFVPGFANAGALCYDYEDWEEEDVFFDDPHHMWEEGPDPEVQEPSGEWSFEGRVNNREGTAHGTLLHFFTADSGEHPSCPGGGGEN